MHCGHAGVHPQQDINSLLLLLLLMDFPRLLCKRYAFGLICHRRGRPFNNPPLQPWLHAIPDCAKQQESVLYKRHLLGMRLSCQVHGRAVKNQVRVLISAKWYRLLPISASFCMCSHELSTAWHLSEGRSAIHPSAIFEFKSLFSG